MGRETRQQIIQAIYQKHYQKVQEIKEDMSSQLLRHMEKEFGEQKNQAHHKFF